LAHVLKIQRDEMLAIATRILERVGTAEADALSVAESLVSAQEAGHTSHGVMRLVEYVDFVKQGQVNPTARPKITSERGAVINLDGQWGWGQIACKLAVELVAERALKFGIATVAIDSCNHIGRLGEYMEMLAKRSLVAIMFCNTGPSVAAHGGKTRLFGTNPFAAAIPSTDGNIVIDFATAGTAEGKIRVSRSIGEEVPEGLIITKDGKPTTNPEAFYEGGALLPFGGHKGYCLSLLIDLLGGAMSGVHPAMNESYKHGNGTMLIAMDPDFFVGREEFDRDITESKRQIKNAPPAIDGSSVLLPGEVEANSKANNLDGIQILEVVWNSILELENSLK
jgi:LDH2 family malate/lactate/ureidoglycolate dehydrogenase